MPTVNYTPSLDGNVARVSANEVWADIIAGAGNASYYEEAFMFVYMATAIDNTKWDRLYRCILLFDTSALPDDAVIVSATLKVYCWEKLDALSITPDMNVYASTPASDTELVVADYGECGTTPFAAAIAYGDVVVEDWNTFTFNADGKAAISKIGKTKLSLRNANYDVSEDVPDWSIQNPSYIGLDTSESAGYEPVLSVVYESGFRPQAIMID